MKFLIMGSLVCWLLACQPNAPATSEPPIESAVLPNLLSASAAEIVPLLKTGELSVEQYVNALLTQANNHANLNAFITLDAEALRAQARIADQKRTTDAPLGPLFGIPIAFKDIIVTADLQTTFATAVLAEYQAPRNAPVVDKLIAAGALVFGKNNAQEWAFGSNGYNSHYGQQLNPYNPAHIAGGSSGGSAAAVSAGMVPIAIGSDTAASIRQPAAFTGLYGLRPTTGRYNNEGVAPIAPTLDTVGPLTRSLADVVLLDQVLADDQLPLNPPPQLSSVRLGVPGGFFNEGVSEEMSLAFTDLLHRLANHGVTLIEAPFSAAQLSSEGLYPILFGEAYPAIAEFLDTWGQQQLSIDALHQGLGADIKPMWDQLVVPGAPEGIPESVYLHAIETLRPALQAAYTAYFTEHQVDAMIFPATAHSAPLAKPDNPQEATIDGEQVSIFVHDHNSSPGAMAGQPGVVLPLVLDNNKLPLGVSLDGRRGEDRALLGVAQAIDAVIPAIPGPPVSQTH